MTDSVYRDMSHDHARQIAASALLMADRYSYAAAQLTKAAEEIGNATQPDYDERLRFALSYAVNAVIPHISVDNMSELVELLHNATKTQEYAVLARTKEKKNG